MRTFPQTVTDSFVEPAATGLAGVGLWVLGDLCGYGPLLPSATLLGIVMAWIVAMVLHSRQYPVMLLESDYPDQEFIRAYAENMLHSIYGPACEIIDRYN